MNRIAISLLAGIICLTAFSACGGSGSNSSQGTVIQGTLIERGSGHADGKNGPIPYDWTAKHSAGEAIEEVKVCLDTTCSLTDGMGQWGVNIDGFSGGKLAVTVEGHGINSQTNVDLPANAKDVVLNLAHSKNTISVEKLIIDGEDHTGHDHSHS
ncbi:MAG: hypothetical protein ACK5GN_02245 [Pseudomonadota bacterium]|jgi:hypothetical protein